MPHMSIKTFPAAILRKKASNVGKVTDADRKILDDMAKTMYLNSGVGLAAVQVGIDKQLAVIDVGTGLIRLVNPVVIKKDGSETQEEGCLSVPGLAVKVKRATSVTVSFLNEDGEVAEIKASGLLARALQHEIDHLAGKLILDYLSPVKRLLAARKKRSTKQI